MVHYAMIKYVTLQRIEPEQNIASGKVREYTTVRYNLALCERIRP